MDYQTLKARQRLERHAHPPNLALRVHRALSWLNRAEQLGEDRDGHFIFLWIAFNAAYATDLDEKYRSSERTLSASFFRNSSPSTAEMLSSSWCGSEPGDVFFCIAEAEPGSIEFTKVEGRIRVSGDCGFGV